MDEDERLAENPPPPIGYELACRIARLALLIAHADNRRNGRLVDGHAAVPWDDYPDSRRVAAAAGATRVVQAMMLLGLIEENEPARLVIPAN